MGPFGRSAFIAVDWGTTNRRAYRVEPGGRCTAEFEDDRGVSSLARHQFPAAVAEIRSRLGDLPLLMAGMIGSTRGWIEAPYVPCPAAVADLAAALVWPEETRTAIVPGLAMIAEERADVMRGEEVQIFGALAEGLVPGDCLICHPGTHNKWVRLEQGRIATFRTIMTGELFSLLREHSILQEMLGAQVQAGEAFAAGVRRGLAGQPLSAELFSVRARVLLGKAAREDAASFTSGLLIGADLAAALPDAPTDEVIVMGRPELTGLYAAALAEAGRASRQVDGETAFLAGIRRIVEEIE